MNLTIVNMASENERREEDDSTVNIYLQTADDYAQKITRGIPNGLTLANLTCGLFSLIMSMNGLHRFSALFILLAAVCDFFDGRVARSLRVTSAIGAQLDSLADIVSFGVAPAILAHSIKYWSFLMIIAFITFPLSGAWRLARFHAHSSDDHSIGLPIPVAGIVVALLGLFSFVSPLIMIGLALLMISPLQIPKF